MGRGRSILDRVELIERISTSVLKKIVHLLYLAYLMKFSLSLVDVFHGKIFISSNNFPFSTKTIHIITRER